MSSREPSGAVWETSPPAPLPRERGVCGVSDRGSAGTGDPRRRVERKTLPENGVSIAVFPHSRAQHALLFRRAGSLAGSRHRREVADLEEPLPWSNSTLLKGDAAAAVATLKEQPGKDFVILGSGVLVQSLMRRNLVDEYVLSIHPLVLGSGRRLFPDGVPFASLQLVDTKTTTTGVVIATYRPAEPTTGKTS
jgi:riboflavin biosynthesis pyrimidine reductase